MIRDGGLTERHARALLRITEEKARLQATAYIIEHQFNVSRTEQYIDKLLEQPVEEKRTVLRLIKDVRLFLNTVDKAVGMMKQSGVDAKVEKEEKDNGMLLHILIPNCKR